MFKALAGYTETMRRWIAIFLLVCLPLQSLWAAAAPYCQHESSAQGAHWGHHQHEHHGASHTELGSGADHADCHGCHGHCADMPRPSGLSERVSQNRRLMLFDAPHLPAAPVALPERPNWSHLA